VPEEYGRRIPPGGWHLLHFDETSQKCVVEYLSEAGGFLLGRNLRNLRRLLAGCHSTSTPLSTSSVRAPSMSGTTSCRPLSEPGSMPASDGWDAGCHVYTPVPIRIEHPEPGGVSWTTRYSSVNAVS
jgi:hypothetical protein